VRDYTQWGNTQLKIHLHRLEELEYLLPHRGGRGQSFVYELLYDGRGKDGSHFLLGLIDVDKLRVTAQRYDAKKSGQQDNLSASSRGQVGPVSGGCRVDENASNPSSASLAAFNHENHAPNAPLGEEENRASYRKLDRNSVTQPPSVTSPALAAAPRTT
jgi:DNA primase